MTYFDTCTKDGFTIRIYYEEEFGIVTITNIELQSTVYVGQWYVYGTIKVNDETILSMGGDGNDTYSIDYIGAGSTWWPVYELKSHEFQPISSARIFAASATISADISVHNISNNNAVRDLIETKTIGLTVGMVYIDNGSGFDIYQCYIDNGENWDLHIPYIDNGSGWDQCI